MKLTQSQQAWSVGVFMVSSPSDYRGNMVVGACDEIL